LIIGEIIAGLIVGLTEVQDPPARRERSFG
jgi:hypothetical protein